MTLITTITLAFVIVLIAASLLGISLIFTGKHKIRLGACGRNPNDCDDNSKTCGLCKKDDLQKR